MTRVRMDQLPVLAGLDLNCIRTLLDGDGKFGAVGLIVDTPAGCNVMKFSERLKEQLVAAIDREIAAAKGTDEENR